VAAQVGLFAALGGVALEDLDLTEQWTVNLVSTALLALITIGWVAAIHRRGPKVFAIRPPSPARDVGWGALIGVLARIASFPIAIVVFQIVDRLVGQEIPEVEQLQGGLTGPALVLAAVTVLIGAPVAEELFFRGFLFRAFRSRRSFAFATTVSAILFALVHWQPEGLAASLPLMVAVGAASVGFCWVYERRGSLLSAMIAHAVFNSIAVAFFVWG
jgi:membrane protease YdiL (CAAX protease family)